MISLCIRYSTFDLIRDPLSARKMYSYAANRSLVWCSLVIHILAMCSMVACGRDNRVLTDSNLLNQTKLDELFSQLFINCTVVLDGTYHDNALLKSQDFSFLLHRSQLCNLDEEMSYVPEFCVLQEGKLQVYVRQ